MAADAESDSDASAVHLDSGDARIALPPDAEDPDETLADWGAARDEVASRQRRECLRRVDEHVGAALAPKEEPVYTDDNGFVFLRSSARPLGHIKIMSDSSSAPRALLKCLCSTHKSCSKFVNLLHVRSHQSMEQWIVAGRDCVDEKAHLKLLDRIVMVGALDDS